MNQLVKKWVISLLLIICSNFLGAQYSLLSDSTTINIPEFNKKRFYTALGIGSVIYGAGTYSLVRFWYSDYGFTSFHTFDDWGEWRHMDKIGHIYTAYNQSSVMFDGARWTGMKKSNSLLFGLTMGMLLQTTIEVLDGFSPKWGFSYTDMTANILGAGGFFVQQKIWSEQRILMKVSSGKRSYSGDPVYSGNGQSISSLDQRANELFGRSFPERYLKDYNAQTYWLSFNLSSLLKNDRIPPWLNFSVGYGAQNMFGGYANTWTDKSDNTFSLGKDHDRYNQYYLTPDIDFRRIPVRSQFLKALFKAMNLVKFPMPGVELNSKGKLKFHYLVF
ncbi:MAG: DUF2279 domain-containing protein [Deltaproteobacteria bacterium]